VNEQWSDFYGHFKHWLQYAHNEGWVESCINTWRSVRNPRWALAYGGREHKSTFRVDIANSKMSSLQHCTLWYDCLQARYNLAGLGEMKWMKTTYCNLCDVEN
jgi:hypothetical protein